MRCWNAGCFVAGPLLACMSAVQGELAVSRGLLGWGVTKLRAIGRMRRALPPPSARSALVACNRPRTHEL